MSGSIVNDWCGDARECPHSVQIKPRRDCYLCLNDAVEAALTEARSHTSPGTDIHATEATSEARRVHLLKLSEERAAEWKRAENAEAERDRLARELEAARATSDRLAASLLDKCRDHGTACQRADAAERELEEARMAVAKNCNDYCRATARADAAEKALRLVSDGYVLTPEHQAVVDAALARAPDGASAKRLDPCAACGCETITPDGCGCVCHGGMCMGDDNLDTHKEKK